MNALIRFNSGKLHSAKVTDRNPVCQAIVGVHAEYPALENSRRSFRYVNGVITIGSVTLADIPVQSGGRVEWDSFQVKRPFYIDDDVVPDGAVFKPGAALALIDASNASSPPGA